MIYPLTTHAVDAYQSVPISVNFQNLGLLTSPMLSVGFRSIRTGKKVAQARRTEDLHYTVPMQ